MSDSRQPDRTEIERTQRLLGERFELQWIIGRGGMSTVWLAHDVEQQRDVAVKILKPEYTENEEFRARFRNEASAAQDLDSPNVVRTYDSGEVEDPDNGTVFCYIIMEYIRGESLADVLSRESSLPQNLALDVLTQTAAGLKAIHEAGLVHRDIKPGNLLITSDGFVKITDFGIAKAAAAVPLTRTGMVVGTAQYVSPEQAQGDQVGPASDVYSLGVVGFEMLAGYRPFSGESTVSVAIKHISETPPELPEEIDPNLRELIRVCLRKSPRTRYADGAELATATVMVAEGKQPPSPHNVPNVSAEPHPLTEQLGNVASGPGTRVPSVPGPQYGPGSGARPGQGPGYPDSSVPVVGAGAPPTGAGYPATGRGAGGAQGASPKKNRWIIAVLALVSILALALATFLLTSGGDEEAPNPSTMTVTNEVTTSPTEEGEPANPSGNVPAPVNPSPTDTTNGPSTTSKTETSREETETSEEREPSFPTLPTIPNGGGRGNGNVNGENGTARQTEPNQPHTNDNATSEDSDMPAELRSPSTNPESQPVL
ncbi:serine/threonine-protein kinase [Corynebacterium jeikeium]|uniref:serine/threonine-protein kinase n=1 Tax=Corynebacterium jeikeium TaxID=38289 RepID=UPI00055126AE|nr:serine/threonine-protein kinase [Corynebacterium jeikeium]